MAHSKGDTCPSCNVGTLEDGRANGSVLVCSACNIAVDGSKTGSQTPDEAPYLGPTAEIQQPAIGSDREPPEVVENAPDPDPTGLPYEPPVAPVPAVPGEEPKPAEEVPPGPPPPPE